MYQRRPLEAEVLPQIHMLNFSTQSKGGEQLWQESVWSLVRPKIPGKDLETGRTLSGFLCMHCTSETNKLCPVQKQLCVFLHFWIIAHKSYRRVLCKNRGHLIVSNDNTMVLWCRFTSMFMYLAAFYIEHVQCIQNMQFQALPGNWTHNFGMACVTLYCLS